MILGMGMFVACGNNSGTADSSSDESKEMMNEKMDASDAAEMVVDSTGPEYTAMYICPMHCKGSGSDQAGTCPVCGMDYVQNPKSMGADADMDHQGHDHDGHDHDHDHEGHDH